MFTSERFPRQLLDEANEFYNNLPESLDLPSGLVPGTMAVMIDMISANKVKIKIKIKIIYIYIYGLWYLKDIFFYYYALQLELDVISTDLFRKTFRQLYYPRLKHGMIFDIFLFMYT